MKMNIAQKYLLDEIDRLAAKKQESNSFQSCDFIDVVKDEYFLIIEEDTEDKGILERFAELRDAIAKDNAKLADELESLFLYHGALTGDFMYKQGLKDGVKMYKLIS